VLQPFLNPQVTLVPVPRSAPLVEGALWPSLVIAQVLQEAGYGQSVQPLLERVTAVPKSSSSPAAERPLIDAHRASLRVRKDLLSPAQITLVDDVLTMGRTTFACAALLQEAFPEATIRIFAMLRTQGMQAEIEAVFDPSVGTITGYDSGKAWREP
jgi:Predicted amidophosphoribosyltransferases